MMVVVVVMMMVVMVLPILHWNALGRPRRGFHFRHPQAFRCVWDRLK